MKLKSCYIENFGGLHQYEVFFQDGITMIEEANGFGKTTLAEFIRAMFYGFPKSAPRALEKNLRKKYKPWQNGNYGGNLIFEENGKEYKIERSFGGTPKTDKLAIYEVKTGKKTTDYTEEIGLELFGLDSDSFARSTYLPQVHEAMNLSTDNIRAKLGNLVDDTNDINNFEDAIKHLKDSRSYFQAYRGNKGLCHDLSTKISELQLDIDECKALRTTLENKKENLFQQEQAKAEKQEALKQIKEQINQVNAIELKKNVTKQYQEKTALVQASKQAVKQVEGKYSNGIPTTQELKNIEPLFDRIIALDSKEAQTKPNDDDKQTVEEGKVIFKDYIPTAEDFVQQKRHALDYVKTKTTLEQTKLSTSEEESLQELQAFFQQGSVDEMFFTARQNEIKEIQNCETKKDLQHLSKEEILSYQNLQVFFASGVPSEESIQENLAKTRKIQDLNDEKVNLVSGQVESIQHTPQSTKQSTTPIICLFVGVLLLVVGIVFFIMKSITIGVIGLVVGILAIVIGLYLKTQQTQASTTNNQTNEMSVETRNKITQNQKMIDQLDREVLAFVSRYITDNRSHIDKLHDISNKRTSYVTLQAKEEAQKQEIEKLTQQMQQLSVSLQEKLSTFFTDIDTYDHALEILKEKDTTYRQLKEKKAEQEKDRTTYKNQLDTLYTELTRFLFPFYGSIEEKDFSNYIDELETKRNAYIKAKKNLEKIEKQQQEIQTSKKTCEDTFAAFVGKYQLDLDIRHREAFQTLMNQIAQYLEEKKKLIIHTKDLETFYSENKDLLTKEVKQVDISLEELQAKEQELNIELEQMQTRILSARQEAHGMERKVDELPAKEDQLQQLKEEREEGLHRKDILDQTQMFLEEAKESLSDQYLGSIKTQFVYYLEKLSGVSDEKISMTTDFQVKVERLGESRDLAYFSMGQSDLVMLCMRFALVDAMFEDSKPFIILDDPFVNLDDENTARALKLLEEIGKERQILYLVCNSSRAIDWN